MSIKLDERKVRLRKLLNFRDHYGLKAAAKRFYSAQDWGAHREWILDGEAWLMGDEWYYGQQPAFYASLINGKPHG